MHSRRNVGFGLKKPCLICGLLIKQKFHTPPSCPASLGCVPATIAGSCPYPASAGCVPGTMAGCCPYPASAGCVPATMAGCCPYPPSLCRLCTWYHGRLMSLPSLCRLCTWYHGRLLGCSRPCPASAGSPSQCPTSAPAALHGLYIMILCYKHTYVE